jgi:gas vesicle protein
LGSPSVRINLAKEKTVSEDNTGKFIWFLAGATVGATVALLYAPQSGRATRRELGRRLDRAQEALSETSQGLYDQGRDLYDKGRKIADDAASLFDKGRKLVEGSEAV